MHTNAKGNITEAEVTYLLLSLGYAVFTPVGDGSEVDLIFKDGNGVHTVQVKSVLRRKNYLYLDLRKSRGVGRGRTYIYSSKDIDFFATTINRGLYLLPVESVKGKSTIVLKEDGDFRYMIPCNSESRHN